MQRKQLDWRSAILVLACAMFIVAVYCPDVGRGFVKDDFTWIRSAKAAIIAPPTLIRPRDPGFYRPLVTASFAFDYAVHGWRPRGYGWTNVALYIACAIAIGALARSIGQPIRSAVLAAFLWAVNPHGINMALVWLSGRTALWLTFFSVIAATLFVRRRFAWGAAAIALALASKEEAVLLPLVLLAWIWMLDGEHRVPAAAVLGALVPLMVYFSLRAITPAFTPATAPIFYRFTTDPMLLIRNVAEYTDRSATLVIVVTLIAMALNRRLSAVDANTGNIVRIAVVWWAGMLAITVWLPVRSSLYAVCPSVGSALAGAALIERFRIASDRRRVLIEPVLASLLLVAVPLYRVRNTAWVEGARVSQRTLATIASDITELPAHGTILLIDEPETNPSNFTNAFGDLTSEALQTVFERPWRGAVVETRVSVPDAIAEYRLEHGRIVAVPR